MFFVHVVRVCYLTDAIFLVVIVSLEPGSFFFASNKKHLANVPICFCSLLTNLGNAQD